MFLCSRPRCLLMLNDQAPWIKIGHSVLSSILVRFLGFKEIRFLENKNQSVLKYSQNRLFWFSVISVRFRYRPERPVCLVPACRPEQKKLHPIPARIPDDSGHLGRFQPFRAGLRVPSMPVPSSRRKTLDCSSPVVCAPAPADACRTTRHHGRLLE